MPQTASGIWYPDGNFTANPRVVAAQQAANLESVISSERLNHGSSEYATAAARDLAIPNPKQGMQCTVAGNPMTYRTNGGWIYTKTLSYPLINSSTKISLAGTGTSTAVALMADLVINPISYATRVFVTEQLMVSSLAGGFLQSDLKFNGTTLSSMRMTALNHTATTHYMYTLAANTALTISVTANANGAFAWTISANSVFNYFQYMIAPA